MILIFTFLISLRRDRQKLRPSKIASADYISSRHGGVLGKVFN